MSRFLFLSKSLYSLGGEYWCGIDDLIVFLISYDVVIPEMLKLPEGKRV